MQKILVAQKESRQRDLLMEAFHRADCEVRDAPDGLFALTQLERNKPDAVVVASDLPGIEVEELCRIVRKDASLEHVRLVVLALDDRAARSCATCDLVIGSGSSPDEVVSTVLEEIEEYLSSTVGVQPGGQSRGFRQPDGDGLDSLQGNLRILSLPELTQVICGSRRTGRLKLHCLDGPAEIYFLDGQVVHATHLGYTGLAAFRWILTSTLAHPEVAFRFESMSKAEAFRCPRTINMAPQRLLLTIAVEIDEDSAPGRGA